MSRVLVLDYSTDATLGPATARWLPPGVDPQLWTMLDEQPLPSLAGFTHLVHSGSALSINDDPPFLDAVLSMVREAVELGRPQLGICYGHQLLARARSPAAGAGPSRGLRPQRGHGALCP